MDLNKINLELGLEKTRFSDLAVNYRANRLSFNLYAALPDNAIIKDYNLTLFDNVKSNKIIKTGLSINTNLVLDNLHPEVRLRGNVIYEKDNNTYELKVDSVLAPSGVNSVPLYSTNLSTPQIDSEEQVINHLIKEINTLKQRIYLLEIANKVLNE